MLTILPIESEGFCLNKREFFDALCLRYSWTPKYLPTNCPCGHQFGVDHALSCPKGGFIHQRHDSMRNLLADLLSQVHKDVRIEPPLQPLTGETLPTSANKTDEARLDVSARSFWQRGQIAFFDVRITNPFAKSHLTQKLETTFKSNEQEKKRKYNNRIITIEHGSFSPFVMSPYGGQGKETEMIITTLAKKLSDKRDIEFNLVLHWLRTKLSFCLLRSAILCLRGSRTLSKKIDIDMNDIEIYENTRRNF